MAFFIILSLENNMEEEKLALGHAQEICSSFDLLTSSFLRIRINEYNCLSVMERGGGKTGIRGGKQPIPKEKLQIKETIVN